MTSIAVVGGGITGLATAHRLCKIMPNAKVHLLESQNRLGGVIETLYDGDRIIEKGADNFATLQPAALELSRDCKLETMLIPPKSRDRRAFVLHRGKLKPIPAGFSLMQPTRIGSILTTSTLSLTGKIRLAMEYFVKARTSTDDESLESFVVRRLGREAFENLVEPIVSGIFTADPTTLSMQATMPQFLEMERRYGGLIRGHLAARKADAKAAARRASGARYEQFRAPIQGMSHWINGVADSLPLGCVRLGCEVRSIVSLQSGRWRLRLDTPQGQSEEEFDGIVLTTPAAITCKIIRDALPRASETIGRVKYASSAVVAMIVKRADIAGRLDGFGAISPTKERRKALAISYTSNKYPGRVPDDSVLLRVFMGGALAPEMVGKSDSELEVIACQEVRDILAWTGTVPEWMSVIRWIDAMPQYLVGHCELLKQIESELSSRPSIQLAGAAYRGVGIPQCVQSGFVAADNLAGHLQN